MINLKPMERIYIKDIDVWVDPYLTMDKIETIGKKMLEYSLFTEREVVKHTLILTLCTDIQDIDNIPYDMLVHNEVIEKVIENINNYYDIDLFVSRSESLQVHLGNFLKTANVSLDKAVKKIPKNFDLNKAIGALTSNDKK